jgi:hypothetical protein
MSDPANIVIQSQITVEVTITDNSVVVTTNTGGTTPQYATMGDGGGNN